MPPIPRNKQAKKRPRKKAEGEGSPGQGDKQQQHQDGQQDDQKGEGKEKLQAYTIVGGRGEVLEVWHLLSKEEAKAVLDIENHEFAKELEKAGIKDFDEKIEIILGNPDFMTAVRCSFVQAIENKGSVEIPTDILTVGLFRILEMHLLIAYTNKTIVIHFYFFSLFWIASSYWSWFLRYPLLLAFAFFFWTDYLYPLRLRQLILDVFNDTTDQRIAARVRMTLSSLLLVTLSSWADWYSLVVFLCFVPAFMLFVERKTSSAVDQNCMGKLREVFLLVNELLVLYFAYYSWMAFLFCLFFFFRTTFRVILGASFVVLTVSMKVLAVIQGYIIPRNRIITIAVFIIFLVSLPAFYFTLSSSWTNLLLNLLVTSLTVPTVLVLLLCEVFLITGTFLSSTKLETIVVFHILLVISLMLRRLLMVLYSKITGTPLDDKTEEQQEEEDEERERQQQQH